VSCSIVVGRLQPKDISLSSQTKYLSCKSVQMDEGQSPDGHLSTMSMFHTIFRRSLLLPSFGRLSFSCCYRFTSTLCDLQLAPPQKLRDHHEHLPGNNNEKPWPAVCRRGSTSSPDVIRMSLQVDESSDPRGSHPARAILPAAHRARTNSSFEISGPLSQHAGRGFAIHDLRPQPRDSTEILAAS
jgi:hypothetical protein